MDVTDVDDKNSFLGKAIDEVKLVIRSSYSFVRTKQIISIFDLFTFIKNQT